jgi:hypothetical protein
VRVDDRSDALSLEDHLLDDAEAATLGLSLEPGSGILVHRVGNVGESIVLMK